MLTQQKESMQISLSEFGQIDFIRYYVKSDYIYAILVLRPTDAADALFANWTRRFSPQIYSPTACVNCDVLFIFVLNIVD